MIPALAIYIQVPKDTGFFEVGLCVTLVTGAVWGIATFLDWIFERKKK